MKSNSISGKEAYLTISDPEALIIKHLVMPSLPGKELLNGAKWQLKDDVPFDLDNAIFDWKAVDEQTDEDGARKNEIVFAVANAETVRSYVSLASECNLEPVGISTDPFNYANILRHSDDTSQVQAVLDISHKDATLFIYKDKKLRFVRKLPFSSERLTQSVTGTLLSDKGKVELSYDKARGIIEKIGIPQDQAQVLQDNIQVTQVISLMRPLLEQLVVELRRSFDYFATNLNEEPPSVLYLAGGGARIKNLSGYLGGELKLSVDKLPLPSGVDIGGLDKEKLDRERAQILNSLGAALAGAESINLLPGEVRAKKAEAIEKSSLRIVAIALCVLFFFMFIMVKKETRAYEARVANARVHLRTITEISTLVRDIQQRDGLVTKIQAGKVPSDSLLKMVSTLIPRSTILHELSLDQGKHFLILKGTVNVIGEKAEFTLTKFMEKLEASPFCVEAALVSSRKNEGIQEFEIRCHLAY